MRINLIILATVFSFSAYSAPEVATGAQEYHDLLSIELSDQEIEQHVHAFFERMKIEKGYGYGDYRAAEVLALLDSAPKIKQLCHQLVNLNIICRAAFHLSVLDWKNTNDVLKSCLGGICREVYGETSGDYWRATTLFESLIFLEYKAELFFLEWLALLSASHSSLSLEQIVDSLDKSAVDKSELRTSIRDLLQRPLIAKFVEIARDDSEIFFCSLTLRNYFISHFIHRALKNPEDTLELHFVDRSLEDHQVIFLIVDALAALHSSKHLEAAHLFIDDLPLNETEAEKLASIRTLAMGAPVSPEASVISGHFDHAC